MNIVRALEVALPELPERIVRRNPPKLDPRVLAKEQLEKGHRVVLVKMPGTDLVYRFEALQWQLIQLFDGERTYAEIAQQFEKETNTAASEDDVKELASYLQTNTPLLYKTAMERNITLQQELRASRSKRKKSKNIDFSDIVIKVWDNADGYITWLYPRLRFLFTPWFVWTSIGMFVLMGWMWADRFGDIWNDSFAFFNFTQKSGSALIEFWFLFGGMAAIHETAHGLVGKHYGANIERMGFTLMYFAPSFFCDATQVWVIGSKWARIATAFAGIWLDLVVCFFATIVWWGTSTGMPVHDLAYKVMMVTGLGISILNLNPLIKLDGYLIFSELVSEPSLKESSTEYLSAWMRKSIFHLPADVPYVPRRRRPFYVIYGILSGMYSYVLLSFLMVITYRILRSFTPEWAFIPASLMGIWVFRSRITLTAKFMKLLYLDKKERIAAWFTLPRIAGLSAAALLIVFLPIWPDFVNAQFVFLPGRVSILRATVPATVAQVSVHEGQSITSGAPLLLLRNLEIESQASQAQYELSRATARSTQAALNYTDFAAAEQERSWRAEDRRQLSSKLSQLSVVSPISGTVTTPHVEDLVGRSLDEGDLLLSVADNSRIRAEVFIPEFSMHDIRLGQSVRMLPEGRFGPVSGTISTLSPATSVIPEGLFSKDQLQGIDLPRFYAGTAILMNDGSLVSGGSGSAKILVGRRSLAGFLLRFSSEFMHRKVW